MTSAFLRATQRIEVEGLIHDSTLDPSAFSWVVGDSETTHGTQVTRLQYDGRVTATPFFQFDLYRDAHYAVYSWDGTEERQEHITGPWPRQALHVARWLAHIADQARGHGRRASHPQGHLAKPVQIGSSPA